MLLWSQILQLSRESKQAVYQFYLEREIPIEIRHHLATWIENNFVSVDVVPGIPEADETIQQLCGAFFHEIEQKSQEIALTHDFTVQFRLQEDVQRLRNKMSSVELYQRMKSCLAAELRLLNQENSVPTTATNTNEPGWAQHFSNLTSNISRKVSGMMNLKSEYLNRLTTLNSLKSKLAALVGERNNDEQLLQRVSLDFAQNGVNYRARLTQKILTRNEEINRCFAMVKEHEDFCLGVAEELVNELQQLVFTLEQDVLQLLKWSSLPIDVSVPLNNVQQWVNDCIETILNVERELQECLLPDMAEIPSAHYQLDSHTRTRMVFLMNTLDNLKYNIVINSMVVVNQPPQLIKQSTKFTTSVALLCGEKFAPCVAVKLLILNEPDAVKLYTNKNPKEFDKGCGDVVNSKGRRSCENASSQLIYKFNNVAISKLTRLDTTNQESQKAMREKYCLMVYTELKLGNNVYSIWSCSVPFAYQVSVSQSVEGLGTIFYDNAFRVPGRIPFAVPEKVSWSKMFAALSEYLKKSTNSKRDLSQTNKRCIGEKIFGNSEFNDQSMISISNFFDKNDNTGKFGVWGWFYSYIKLIKEHLQPYWNNGYIIGFMNLEETEEIMRKDSTDSGTFIVRFSNSQEGAVTITVGVPVNGTINIENLAPVNDERLRSLSLSNRIRGYCKYQDVYHLTDTEEAATTPKEFAFKPLVPKSKRKSNVYIPINVHYTRVELIMSAIEGTPSQRRSVDSGVVDEFDSYICTSDDEDIVMEIEEHMSNQFENTQL